MFWPVFYMIIFAAVYIVIRGYDRRTAGLLLGVALVIQIADTHAGWAGIHKKLMSPPDSEWKTILKAPFWEEAARKYAKVRWVKPVNQSRAWQSLAIYAGTNGLATDAVYLARVDASAVAQAQTKAAESLQTGRYETDSLYILEDDLLDQAAPHLDANADVLLRVDGLNVIAPAWKQKCPDCWALYNDRRHAGERMEFRSSAPSVSYLGEGWAQAETWGTWSLGQRGIISLPFLDAKATSLLIEARPLISPTHPTQKLSFSINGVPAGNITLSSNELGTFQIAIPREAMDACIRNKLLTLEFRFPNAASPKEMGINGDLRPLALGLVSITVL